jgi:Undecaprenyl-phosphate galactose phosphotransferase WbaP
MDLSFEPKGMVKHALYSLLVIVGDLSAFYLALWISYILRVDLLSRWIPVPFTRSFESLALRVWMPLMMVVVFAYEGLYAKRVPFWEETRAVVKALFLSFLAILSIVSLGKFSSEVSRAVIVNTGIVCLVLLPLVRMKWKALLHTMDLGTKRTVLIGDSPIGRLAHQGFFRDHYMGIRLVGFVTVPERFQIQSLDGGSESEEQMGQTPSLDMLPPLPCLGTLDSLSDLVVREGIRGAVVAAPALRRSDLARLVEKVQRSVFSVYMVPNISHVSLLNSELLYLFYEEMFLVGVHNNLKSRINRWFKESFDISLAILLCVPLLPVLITITLLLKFSSTGPVFFAQRRVGQNGKIFSIYKFRTMHYGAEELLADLLANNPSLEEEYRKNRKLRNDPRVTAFGRFLRRTSLDELPQLFNVLRGEMSLVGPRPAMEVEIKKYYQELESEYGLVKPGITGLWQVSGRSNNDFSMRVRLDLWYIKNWSLWLDLVILVRTVGVVLGRKGAL